MLNVCVMFAGDKWSEESILAFEALSHTAKWKVLMAKTTFYRQDELGSMPCIELVDTHDHEVRYVLTVLNRKVQR